MTIVTTIVIIGVKRKKISKFLMTMIVIVMLR